MEAIDLSMHEAAEALRAQIQAREAEIGALKNALEEIEKVAVSSGKSGGYAPASNEYAKLGMTEAVKLYLQELGRSATSRELWDGISSRGLRSGSKNPINSLGSVLRQARKTFRRLDDGTWTLVTEHRKRLEHSAPASKSLRAKHLEQEVGAAESLQRHAQNGALDVARRSGDR